MGKLIAISGLDGVGKSTQIKLLVNRLSSLNNTVSSGESMFTYLLLKPLIKTLRQATNSPSAGPVMINTNIFFKLWFLFAFIDIWFSYIVITKPKLKKFDYILADRYYTDIWANLLYYGYLPKIAFNLVKWLPRPDLQLLLLTTPEVILKREREFNPKYYSDQYAIYKHLGTLLNCKIIDANDSKESIHEKILSSLES